MINSSISSWWLPERERLTKGVTWVMVVRGRPPNDHAVIGLARGMVEMFHLRAVAESRKFPSAPESSRAWPVCEPPWKESRKGSWVRVAGEFVQGEGPTRTLHFTGGVLTFKGHWRERSDQPCHNTSTTPELNVPVSVVAWAGADPVAWAQPQQAGDSPHRMTRPPGGATGRWVDGAGDSGLDGPPHGAQGWSDYPAPGEDPPQLVRRRWPHLVPPENEHAARPHSSRKPPLKSETEWHSRWQNTSSVTTETAEPPPHPPGLIGRKLRHLLTKIHKCGTAGSPRSPNSDTPFTGAAREKCENECNLCFFGAITSRLQWKHQRTLGEKGLAGIWITIINWGIVGMWFRFQRNARTEAGPRLAASRCRSSTRVRSSANLGALRASHLMCCGVEWVHAEPSNAPCCTRAARSGSVSRWIHRWSTDCSVRKGRGRIQMRVTAECVIWNKQNIQSFHGQSEQRWSQNPLPHKWVRSRHTAGVRAVTAQKQWSWRAARKSEREAEPSAARPQLTRNGRL